MEHDFELLRSKPVAIDVAPWFLGGKPENMGDFLGWDLVQTSDGFIGQNIESVRGQRPKLLVASRLGNKLDLADVAAYGRVVDRLSKYDGLGATPDSWDRAVQMQQAISRQHPDELIGGLAGFKALVIGAEQASTLPPILAQMLNGLVSGALPHAALFLVESTERLGRRYGIARAMLHTGDGAPETTRSGDTFSSSLRMMEDINIGLAAYLEPLVTSLSPHVWATTAPRAGGILILSFGRAIGSTPLIDLDLLSLSKRSVVLEALPHLDYIPPSAFSAATRWWISRLDLAFSHLTDPANYVANGRYDPPSAWNAC